MQVEFKGKPKKGSFLETVMIVKDNPVAAFIGFAIGGSVPCMIAYVAHFQAPTDSKLWGLVAAGLVFSILKTYKLATELLGGEVECLRGFSPSALGFVLLLEAGMTFGHDYLPIAPLVILSAFIGFIVARAIIEGREGSKTTQATTKRTRKPKETKVEALPEPMSEPMSEPKPRRVRKAKAEPVADGFTAGDWATAEA